MTPPVDELTDRQRRIVEFVRGYTTAYRRSPSLREIAAAVGLATPSAAAYQLDRLEEMGFISRGRPGSFRRIVPVFDGCCGVCGHALDPS